MSTAPGPISAGHCAAFLSRIEARMTCTQGPVWESAGILIAAPPEHSGPSPFGIEAELLRRTRLADARLTHEHDQLGSTRLRFLQRHLQGGHLRLPPDKCLLRPAFDLAGMGRLRGRDYTPRI
jgi:hypothetical protein